MTNVTVLRGDPGTDHPSSHRRERQRDSGACAAVLQSETAVDRHSTSPAAEPDHCPDALGTTRCNSATRITGPSLQNSPVHPRDHGRSSSDEHQPVARGEGSATQGAGADGPPPVMTVNLMTTEKARIKQKDLILARNAGPGKTVEHSE